MMDDSKDKFFVKILKSYLGFLQGTGKSSATIGSYAGDLNVFHVFLQEKKKDFKKIEARDLRSFLTWMESKGFKTNTRRRKLLTVKGMVRYAVSRKKIFAADVKFLPTPDRLERLPWIPRQKEFSQISDTMGMPEAGVALRNKILFRLLSETGLAVAELCALRWDQVLPRSLLLQGKREREIALNPDTASLLALWSKEKRGDFVFPGFNRFGPTSMKISPRGVELLFRKIALVTGRKSLKPKTLRHYAIVSWLQSNVDDKEIQRRLGVHKNFSLAPYKKCLETFQ